MSKPELIQEILKYASYEIAFLSVLNMHELWLLFCEVYPS